ncbi:lasso peptide isopeptide bond-forming cyclase [Neobacillus cucumis]|uniref:lasso peptide isopeptide bond-forming cyclase n=1 Tax=Neobacillus cucumis TaxID=1740721 RepID=UPI001964B7A7|nr:lasso peptide isopeptide bond-forming cyclase [Neobacillus cucumis]MBM7651876.1 asparagine synthase (glutamine-hydrolyzing) [Neobacillus cucumis]
MSAIAGIYHLNDEPINLEHGNRMMKELEKYPADDIKTWQNDKVFLGCHAQWITPESIGEKIPYYDHQRKLAITADAIIDNRDELIESLQINKRRRKEITDSELILLSYFKWGEEAPKYLIGDFAFMIWDQQKQQLFGARDPSGYRTLYYHNDAYRFSFCTTIAPLLLIPNIKKKLNELYLAEFLAITGMIDTVDAHMTPYSEINQVPPFHSITIHKDKVKIIKYGVFTPKEKLKLKSSEEYVEAFQEVFQKAVNCRLRTHRKIGSQLSGGLDSGAVVGFAAQTLQKENKTLNTFSYIPPSDFVDFTRKELMPDERPFIKKTVGYVGGISDHYYDFEGISSYSEIDEILEINEMPYKFLENSFWLKGMFEKAYEVGIGVLLNGDKGNFTVSWGSALDYYAILLKRLKWLSLSKELNQFSRLIGGARFRWLPTISKIGFPFLVKQNSLNPTMLINPSFAKRSGVFRKLKEHGINESGWIASPNLYEQRRVLFEDMAPWNAGNTLDCKLSLKYSLWKRDPTNDIRVVRFCLSVPEEQCVQNGQDRSLIRRATENYLPDEVRLNQRIRGIQGVDWLHRMIPDWKNFINDVKKVSNDSLILDYIDGNVLSSALAKGEKGAQPKNIIDSDYRTLMLCLIVYRYINNFT